MDDYQGDGYDFYWGSCLNMSRTKDNSVALTVTSPPYWTAIDYDSHVKRGKDESYRDRKYYSFGETYYDWLCNIHRAFAEVKRVTMSGGFCAVVIGTILHDGTYYAAPYDLVRKLADMGWRFHQDIIWNKVTGGVKRAGVFIQHPKLGYYYPNIMTEYIMVFKNGKYKRRGSTPTIPIDDVFKKDIANNIWHIAPVPPNTVEHPCPYPDELARRLVLLYSQEGDTVLDPFLGSGTTARMAVAHNRHAVGYEVEDRYLQLPVNRLLKPITRKYQLIPTMTKIEA